MSNEIHWSKRVEEEFIKRGNLTEEQIFLLRTRIQKKPISWQSQQLNVSTRTIDRMIRQMKHIYDIVQQESPDIFPPRKVSSEEKYMDTH